MNRHLCGGLAAGIVCLAASASRADEARERELERKLEQMQRQLDELSRRVGDGSSGAAPELEQRVAELEQITKKDKDGVFPYWGKGWRFDSVDGSFKLQILGRIQFDTVFFKKRDDRITEALGETNTAQE